MVELNDASGSLEFGAVLDLIVFKLGFVMDEKKFLIFLAQQH